MSKPMTDAQKAAAARGWTSYIPGFGKGAAAPAAAAPAAAAPGYIGQAVAGAAALYQAMPTLLAVKDMAVNGTAAVVNGAVSAATAVKDTVGSGNLGYAAVAVGVAAAGYTAFQYLKPDELKRFQSGFTGREDCAANAFFWNPDNLDGEDNVKCVAANQFNCSKKIYGKYRGGYLYCADSPAPRVDPDKDPEDIDYTDKINTMITAMQKAAAAATPEQKQAADAAATKAVAAEDKAKDAVIEQTDQQLQKVVHNQQAAGTQAVATQAQIETKIAELKQKQAQPGISPAAAAAISAEIAQLEAQAVANAEKLKATAAGNVAATQQIASGAIQAGASIEAKTDAALAQASTKAPLTYTRGGQRPQTKFLLRGRTTTIHHPRTQYVYEQRRSVAPRSAPLRKKRAAAVKVVGGKYEYYVMPRRGKRCKTGFTQGVSKKGKRTCRANTNY